MTKESVTKVENMEWLDGHYTGEVSDGVPYGQGSKTWSTGRKDVGEYRDGQLWAGTITNKDGEVTQTWSEGEVTE